MVSARVVPDTIGPEPVLKGPSVATRRRPLAAERPERRSWIAPMTFSQTVSYLLLAGVARSERGTEIGAALAARLNAEVLAAGVPLTLLNYAQVNPLSVPFWSQQGYRPLWSYWEARPAAMLH